MSRMKRPHQSAAKRKAQGTPVGRERKVGGARGRADEI